MPAPSPLLKTIEAAADQFVEEMVGLIRVAARQQILQALGMEDDTPRLPMPNRKPKYLGPAKTRKKKAPKELPLAYSKAYKRIKKAKRPVTVTTMAKTLGTTESRARQVLGKLLKEKLVTSQTLGDGTARKAYLPS